MKKQLNKNDVEKINNEIAQQFGVVTFFDKKDRLTIADIDHKLFILKDDVILFFYQDGKLIPTLKLLMQKTLLKTVVVDMGAVKFVSSGADVMRPGIVELDHALKKDELVVVVDQNHKKPLCVARALFSGEEIFRMKQGKVLKTLHFVGDKIWSL